MTSAFSRMGLGRLAKNPSVLIGCALLGVLVLVAVIGPVLVQHDPVAQDIRNRLAPPSMDHPFGTDLFGRDVLSRVLHGSRLSLMVAGLITLSSVVFGIVAGLVSGYYLGVIDMIVMRIADAMLTLPAILLAIGVLAVVGPGSHAGVIIALTIVYTPRMARVVRASVIALRAAEFVEAARALGGRDVRTMFRHLLPNCIGPITVQATITFAYAILSEAGLSYLGLGAPPPAPSWGNVVGEGQQLLHQAPWVAIFPSIAISLTVLAANVLGDGLRDALDPTS